MTVVVGGWLRRFKQRNIRNPHCSNEPGGPNGVATIAGQSGSRWLSALADKLKFTPFI